MLSKSKIKMLSAGKSLYNKHLQGFIPLYDIEKNCVCIPDPIINQCLKGQLSDIKGLNSAHFRRNTIFA